MQKIRYWSFPIGLALAWILSTVYTIDTLADAHNAHQQLQETFAASSART
jgi:hypothetical protein